MDHLNVMLEEYKTLREESLQTMRNRNTILSFGIAVLAALFHAGVTALTEQNTKDFAFIVFNPIIPVASMLILTIWLGEADRMARVGVYLSKLEIKINERLATLNPDRAITVNPLWWENWLRTPATNSAYNITPQLRYHYVAVLILFFSVAFSSLIISTWFINNVPEWARDLLPNEFLGLILIAFLVCIYSIRVDKEWQAFF